MKIKEVIRKKQNRLKKSLLGVLAVSAATVSLFPQTVMASGVSDVTQPLMNLKTLVISIIGAVGVIILAKNVMEFAQAYQQQDSSSMNSAIKGIFPVFNRYYLWFLPAVQCLFPLFENYGNCTFWGDCQQYPGWKPGA